MKKLLLVIMIVLSLLVMGNLRAEFAFTEDWETGSIDPATWKEWGSPSPYLYSPGHNSDYALDANGDSNEPSGVVSYENLTISNGIWFEFWAKGNQSASASQNIQAGIGPAQAEAYGINPPGGLLVGIAIMVETQYDFIRFISPDGVVEGPDYPDDDWHHYAFEIKQDGSVDYWMDGLLEYSTDPGAVDFSEHDNLPVDLRGRSYGDVQLQDDLIVMYTGEALELYDPTEVAPRDGYFAVNGVLSNNSIEFKEWFTQVHVILPSGVGFDLGAPLQHDLWPGEREIVYTVTEVPGGIPTGDYQYVLKVSEEGTLIDADTTQFEVIDATVSLDGTIPDGFIPLDLSELEELKEYLW